MKELVKFIAVIFAFNVCKELVNYYSKELK